MRRWTYDWEACALGHKVLDIPIGPAAALLQRERSFDLGPTAEESGSAEASAVAEEMATDGCG